MNFIFMVKKHCNKGFRWLLVYNEKMTRTRKNNNIKKNKWRKNQVKKNQNTSRKFYSSKVEFIFMIFLIPHSTGGEQSTKFFFNFINCSVPTYPCKIQCMEINIKSESLAMKIGTNHRNHRIGVR